MSLSTYYLEYGCHVVVRTCPRNNTASHDNHKNINSWVFFFFLYEYGAPLGGPLGCWSSAIMINLISLACISGFNSCVVLTKWTWQMRFIFFKKILFSMYFQFGGFLFMEKKMFFFSNQSSSGESAKLSTQLEYSVYVLHHGKFYIHVLGQLNVNIFLAGNYGGFIHRWLVHGYTGLMVSALDSRLSSPGVRTLARFIVLCSWARHLTLTVALSAQVYQWYWQI